MSTGVVVAFIATCFVLAVTPGPNMALIIANTLRGGFRAGVLTLAGTASGLSILVAIAAVGMTSIVVLMGQWFDLIRWIGALYLVLLGGWQIWRFYRGGNDLEDLPRRSGRSHYWQGVAVALSNPKVLLFLGAFLPQFITPAEGPGLQLAILSVLFVATLTLVDLMYSFAIARARQRLDVKRLRVLDCVAGALLVAGGLVLAGVRR
jgi:threonine/homoserine/homoserine lactone efflux protein